MNKEDIIRFWIHFPVGVLCVAFLLVNAHLHWGLLVSFMIYEIMNDWRKKDWSFKDIYGFVFGYGIGASALCLRFYLGWLL